MNRKISKIISILLITLSLTIGMKTITFGVTAPTLDSLKTYKLVNNYIIFNNKIGNSGELLNTKTTIKLGTDLNSPYMINVSDFKASEGTITKDENGVYVLTDIISSIAPNNSHHISIERTFTTGTIDYNIDKSKVTSDYSQLDNYADYLKPEVNIEVNDIKIQAKAKALTADITNIYDKAFAIFKFVNKSMDYNLNSTHANNGALSALTYKEGVCQDYAQLFVALCRASKIPARTVSGFRNIEKPITSTIDLTNKDHMWVEVFLPNYGWVIAEPTELFILNGVINKTVKDDILMEYFGKALEPAEHIANDYIINRFGNAESTTQYDTSEGIPEMITTSNEMLYIIDDVIAAATNAMVKAESSKLEVDIDSAMLLVNALSASVDKADLTTRLNIVQSAINATGATNAVFKAGWNLIDGNWYYGNTNGIKKTGWVSVKDKWYYLEDSGIMKTGWALVDNNWYYLENSGDMKIGWVLSGNKWYYLENSGVMRR